MPSVIVSWSGRCSDQKKIVELTDLLKRIGDVSHAYIDDRTSPLVYDNLEICGRIAVSKILVDGTTTNEELVFTDRIILNGITFRLYDPRSYSCDLLNFVSADTPDFPQLNGALVECLRYEKYKSYARRSRQLNKSDFLLTKPTLHLRYMYERWIDQLLAWTKAFFVPNLVYWHHSDLPEFEPMRKRCLESFCGQDNLKNVIFQELLDSFVATVKDWQPFSRNHD